MPGSRCSLLWGGPFGPANGDEATRPQAEFGEANRILALLDSDPLQLEDEIRTILAGCSQEFVDLCCTQFVPGKRISFDIEFPL